MTLVPVGLRYVPFKHIFDCLECWCEWQWANSAEYREAGGPTAYDLQQPEESDSGTPTQTTAR